MKDTSSSTGDTPSSREDQSGPPSSGAWDSRDGPEGAEGNAGVPNGPDCSAIPGAGRGTGHDHEGTLEEDATLVEELQQDPEQEGESEESQFLEFALTVPFLSFMDAEIARMYLALEEEPLEEGVHRELRVTGSDLIIRMTSEDSSLLQSSVSSALSQLSTVVTALRSFAPQFLAPRQE